MKRFILSISVLSALLLSGYYEQTTAAPINTNTATVLVTDVAKLPTSSLPAPAKSYLDQHYAGYALVRIEKAFTHEPRTRSNQTSLTADRTFIGTRVRFLVNDVPFDLFFDTAGNVAGTHAPGPRGEVDKSAYLTVNQLPATVRDYLSKTYKGYTFLKAQSHQSPTGSANRYNVEILTNNQRADLHFDTTGTFRDAHVRAVQATDRRVSYVTRKELPAPIAQRLTSSYADQTYVLGEKHVGPNGTDYVIELVANNELTRLHVDETGKVIARPSAMGGPGPDGRGPIEHGPADRRPDGKGPGGDGPKHRPDGGPGAPRPDHNPGRERPRPGDQRADANRQILLDASKLPSTVAAYLKANFNNYTFLKATVHSDNGTPVDYATDIAMGKALYKLRFAGNGDVLMAEAKN